MATLLLADDSVTIQRVIELTLADEGIQVIVVSDGEAAIARIDEVCPDIVLADVGIARVDGYQVAAHIKRTPALAHVPVLLLTGAFEPIDEDRARKTGCDGVLVKPFEPRQLLTKVKELLSGARPCDLWPQDMPRLETRTPLPPAPQPPEEKTAPAAVMLPAEGERDIAALEEPGPLAQVPPVEAEFEHGLDDLDLAFSRLDPDAPAAKLDASTVSDFQRDLDHLCSTTGDDVVDGPAIHVASTERRKTEGEADFSADLGWDLPDPLAPEEFESPPAAPYPLASPSVGMALQPVLVAPPPPPPPPPPVSEPERTGSRAVPRPPSLADAFSALLAAEQVTRQPVTRAPAGGGLSEAAVEKVVRRVLIRMTDEIVRQVSLEAAEQLIREEIDRIKS
ncbi:MAG: response regulator [Acidobacteria bacterium]|nr:response regulator [Acidobacteriota bacterium]